MTSFLAVAVLVIVHAAASKLRLIHETPRSRWLSAAGGVSAAYVFLHLLPGLAESSRGFGLDLGLEPAFALAFAGLVVFYGLMRAAAESRRSSPNESTSPRVFWLHLVVFAVYNAVIGAMLHRQESLVLFTCAMALHFLVVDYGLDADHREPYRRYGRWVIIAAIVVGWGLSLAADLPEVAVEVLISILAGAIVLNVMKEELPADRESRFLPFLTGGVGYGALLWFM